MLGVEWDFLSDGVEISEVDEVINLPFEAEDVASACIKRNESFDIHVKIKSKKEMDNRRIKKGKAGEIQDFGKILCKLNEGQKIVMDYCYFMGQHRHMTKELSEIEFSVKAQNVIIQQNEEKEIAVCRECFINFIDNPFVFMGLQEREKECALQKIEDDEIKKLMGSRCEEVTDKIHVRYGKNAFDIIKIDKAHEPEWSNKVAIEYRVEYGYIPNDEERKKINCLVSFLLGKQLLSVCVLGFDIQGELVRGEFYDAKDYNFDLEKVNTLPSKSPIDFLRYENRYNFVNALESLLPKFLMVYEHYQFEDILNYYWYARLLAPDVNLPLAAAVLENIMKKWYKTSNSKSKGVLMLKEDYDSLTSHLIEEVEKQLEGYLYKSNIVNRLSRCFNMGVGERFEIFFAEIQLKIGTLEKEALKARNSMSHDIGQLKDEDLQKNYLCNEAYFVLLNRVILKLLGYKGNYVDYSCIGFPVKHIDIVAGCEEKE